MAEFGVCIDNTANGYSGGGAIYFLSNSGSIEGNSFVNCVFIDNMANECGGAIYFSSMYIGCWLVVFLQGG